MGGKTSKPVAETSKHVANTLKRAPTMESISQAAVRGIRIDLQSIPSKENNSAKSPTSISSNSELSEDIVKEISKWDSIKTNRMVVAKLSSTFIISFNLAKDVFRF